MTGRSEYTTDTFLVKPLLLIDLRALSVIAGLLDVWEKGHIYFITAELDKSSSSKPARHLANSALLHRACVSSRSYAGVNSWVPLNVKHVGPPEFFSREVRARMNAPLEVVLVFRRVPGCQDADLSLINAVAREAINVGLHPKLLAATVAVESRCNPHAVSSRGALGLTQVVARVWDNDFGFSHINLLDASENLRTGAIILANLIRSHGLRGGLQHYNGAASECPSCGNGYSERVLELAGMNTDEVSSTGKKMRGFL